MENIESASASSHNENQCKKSVIIDIPHNLEPVLWLDQCCIYKVPRNLRQINEAAYTPQLISIGPLHRDNQKLAEMEEQKLIYLSEFCERTKMSVNDFVSIIIKMEEKIRRSYAQKSKLCSDEYVKMILLDAVFIIELFRRNFDMKEKEEELYQGDCMFKKQWLKSGIQQDLLLLENQLPYFVLNELFKSAFPENYQPTFQKPNPLQQIKEYTFHDLAFEYFKDYKPPWSISVDPLHFTDLLRYFMSKTQSKPKKNSRIKNQCSATKLHEAGVKFKKKEKACLTEICFNEAELICCKGAKLTMTQFEVDDNTERVIRNLMALEQCHYPCAAYICNYIFLMDSLINTTKDVDLLVENEVIVNSIGSNEAVAGLVNELCRNIELSNFCYHEICQGLTRHCEKRRYRSLQLLRSVYFANIWRGTGTVAAFVLLVLTLLQTISSFL